MSDETKLGLIGRDRYLIDMVAKQFHETGKSHNYMPITTTKRGATFELQLVVDRKTTGHVVRVTVELDRIEQGHEG